MKFVKITQNGSLKRISCWEFEFEFLKIQDSGGRHFEKPLNRYISASIWPILMKSDNMMHIGTPNVTEHLKLQFSKLKMADGR